MNQETPIAKPVGFIVAASKPYLLAASIAALAVISASVADALAPYFFKKITDAAFAMETNGMRTFVFWSVGYLLTTLVSVALWRVSGFAGMRWVTGVRATGRSLLSAYVLRHDHAFFVDRFAGAVAGKIGSAAEGAKDLVDSVLWTQVRFLITLVLSFALTFMAHPYIGAVFVAWLLVVALLNVYFVKRKVPLSVAAEEAETTLKAHTIDILTNITSVLDFARRKIEMFRLQNLIDARRRAGLRNWTYSEVMLIANSVVELAFTAGMVGLSVFFLSKNILSPGDVILILTLTFNIRGELAFIGHSFNRTAENYATIKQGLADLVEPYALSDGDTAEPLAVSKGEVSFAGVHFGYSGSTIFNNLTLTIYPGQKVGIVGMSGAGKTTLARLLLRYRDPTQGQILIDGQDIAQVTIDSLRESIAVVPQEPSLFHRSIKENIAYGNPEVSIEEIKSAAANAQAAHFIETLPEGYDTLIGERGIKLSGGQRQRIAIARAMLKNAPILILDEATSALDSESEAEIQKALHVLMKGKTVIAIAHRLSTLREMDRIIVLHEGRAMEDGSHTELIARGGIYADLWNHQAGGFIGDEQ